MINAINQHAKSYDGGFPRAGEPDCRRAVADRRAGIPFRNHCCAKLVPGLQRFKKRHQRPRCPDRACLWWVSRGTDHRATRIHDLRVLRPPLFDSYLAGREAAANRKNPKMVPQISDALWSRRTPRRALIHSLLRILEPSDTGIACG